MLQNTKTKLLVIGSSGQVASALKELADERSCFVGRPTFDLQKKDHIAEVFDRISPALVINCAAYTAVDLAETEQDKAYAINAIAAKDLAVECKKHRVPLIHISTDYVFDGKLDRPYLESDQPSPLSVYGKSKLAGEEYIQEILSEYIIIRTTWVFSEYGNNFVKTMVKLSEIKDEISIVSDQIGCPTSANSIALAIHNIANKILFEKNIPYGIYNYTDLPAVSWYEFASEIFKLMKNKYSRKVPTVNQILSSEYISTAVRPLNSRLDCSLIEKNFGIKSQDWHIELEHCLEKLIKNKK